MLWDHKPRAAIWR